jgi:dinuclear metal center YbgI/SA1388 family protein
MTTVAEIVEFLERFAPPNLAADWDNVGLLLGDRQAACRGILTCLTVTPEVADEAIAGGAGLIVTHHPVLFRAVKRLTTGNPEGRMLLALIQAGVAVYSPHTAFDNTPGGINDALAKRLELKEVGPLRHRDGPRRCKLVVFVPEADLARVSDAAFAAGAGHIGQYSQCSFRLPGTGTFFGSESTKPAVGKKGRREEVSELRLEVICPEGSVERVIAAVRKAHPYEEPAYDVYPLRAEATGPGEGRLGRLKKPVLLGDFAKTVKAAVKAAGVQVVGATTQKVERVAVVCGAGGQLLHDVTRARADVFVTGELRFHDYLEAQNHGLALCLPGHYATERFGVEELAGRLQEDWPELKVWASRKECDPCRWL